MDQADIEWIDMVTSHFNEDDFSSDAFNEILDGILRISLDFQTQTEIIPERPTRAPRQNKEKSRICGAKTLKNGNCQRKVLHTEFCKSHENSPRLSEECGVCYEQNVSKKTSCNHAVCFACVKQIVKINNQPKCPMCRASLV